MNANRAQGYGYLCNVIIGAVVSRKWGNIWILILTTFKQNSGKILGGAPAPPASSQDALTGPMDGPHWHAQLASQSRWRGMPDLESGQR
jgi:hypothetical protein